MIADVVLEGNSVRLRPVREDDLPQFQRWLSNPEVYQWLFSGVMAAQTWEDELAWWQRIRVSEGELAWSIETLDGRLLGDMTLHCVPRAKRATFGIFIGDRAEWDKGYAQRILDKIVKSSAS